MVRHTRVRTASDLSTSFGPPQSSSPSSLSYLNNFGVGDKIPGFRTSAAFFTSLRANLHLTETTDPFLSLSPSTDMSSSAASTPPSLPANPSSLALPPPSSSSSSPLATTTTTTHPSPSSTTADTIPALTTHPTRTPATLLAALHLIADSVAQQRQSASRAIIFHPLVLAAFTALLAVVAQLLYGTRGDLALVATTWAGCVMAGLVGVRWAVGGYIEVAEGIGWRWLEDGRKSAEGEGEREGEDVVVVSEWGEEVIGAMVVRFVREEQHLQGAGGGGGVAGKGRRTKAGKGSSTAYIRAWTVKLRFRGKGVGTGLLEEAVRLCHEKGADALEFAADHANSARVLPAIFNGGFERREAKARKMLEEVVRAQGGVGGKRR